MTLGNKRVSRTLAWVRTYLCSLCVPVEKSRDEHATDSFTGNVLSAKAPNEKVPFVSDADMELFQKYRDAAFEVQVGLHELTGKLRLLALKTVMPC